jgi:DNA repair photolyase
MKQLKTPLTIRGDSLYCPLSFSLDTYGNCEADCLHCYLRRLNATWGKELKPVNLDILQKTMINGLANKQPKSSLAWALNQKKTLRFGNKTDPFQPVERTHRVSREALRFLLRLEWTVVVQTMFTEIMMDYQSLIVEMKDLITIQPIISPGFDRDWEIL